MSQITSWVDAHHHLWDLDALHYSWLSAKGESRFFGQPDPIRKNHFVKNLLLVINSKFHKVLKTLLAPFWVNKN
jgi:predicted TIM-barrel fold metal-dependent hydrolase